MEVVDAIKNSLTGTFNTVAEFIPTLISALLILIVGWIIAKLVKWAIAKVLKAVSFDNLADKVGVNSFLKKGGMKQSASGLISTLVYWIIMFTVLVTFFNSLGLDVVSNLLNKVILFIPNIIVACVLLIVGMYLAEFVSGIVVGTLKGGSYENPETIGRIAYGAVTFFTIALALNQLGIGQGIINNVVSIVLGALGIALAISFGLGGKDWAAGMVNKHLKK